MTTRPFHTATAPEPHNLPPVAHADDLILAAKTSPLLSTILTGTDPENAPLSYSIIDRTAGGSFLVLDGKVLPTQQLITLTAEQYARAEVVLGPAGSVDHFWAAVSDGVNQSARIDFTLTAVNVAPVVQAFSLALPRNTNVGGEFVVKATDDNGDDLTIFVRDENATAGSGEWIFKGLALAAHQDHAISSSDFGQLRWKSATINTGIEDQVTVWASDGTVTTQPITVTLATAKNEIPTVTVDDQTVKANVKTNVLPWIKFEDPDKDKPAYFGFKDENGGGYFELNGGKKPEGVYFDVSISDMPNLLWVSGPVGSTEDISIRAHDGWEWSWPAHYFEVTTVAGASAEFFL